MTEENQEYSYGVQGEPTKEEILGTAPDQKYEDEDAQNSLGWEHENGIEVNENEEKAVQGHADAQNNPSVCDAKDISDQNKGEDVRLAAAQGDEEANLRLGVIVKMPTILNEEEIASFCNRINNLFESMGGFIERVGGFIERVALINGIHTLVAVKNEDLLPDGSFTIPEKVTVIGNSAFKGCTGLTSITIPPGVTAIGEDAFSDCTGLTSITIPVSVTDIGEGAFFRCTGLTSITIPPGVTAIEESAFSGCRGLTSITIPPGVTEIGRYAFFGCEGLTSITIPPGVTEIEHTTFSGCRGLTSITIPPSVTSIGEEAFNGCRGLTSITIPPGVTEIEDNTFSDCTGLTSITIPLSVTAIGKYAFLGCEGLTSITIPPGVTAIGDSAFSCCTGLTSITIPPGVTAIGESAFEECTGLTSITIDEGITCLESELFTNCENLISIRIPKSLEEISQYAFLGCKYLQYIVFVEPDSRKEEVLRIQDMLPKHLRDLVIVNEQHQESMSQAQQQALSQVSKEISKHQLIHMLPNMPIDLVSLIDDYAKVSLKTEFYKDIREQMFKMTSSALGSLMESIFEENMTTELLDYALQKYQENVRLFVAAIKKVPNALEFNYHQVAKDLRNAYNNYNASTRGEAKNESRTAQENTYKDLLVKFEQTHSNAAFNAIYEFYQAAFANPSLLALVTAAIHQPLALGLMNPGNLGILRATHSLSDKDERENYPSISYSGAPQYYGGLFPTQMGKQVADDCKKQSSYLGSWNGQALHFEEDRLAGDGDCGLHGLGISREVAVSLLLDAKNDQAILNLVAPEIMAAAIEGTLKWTP